MIYHPHHSLRSLLFLTLIFAALFSSNKAAATNFDLVTSKNKVTIVYDAAECKLNGIAANLLADDIASVSGYKPVVLSDLTKAKGNIILIGSINSNLIKAQDNQLTNTLQGKWECYGFRLKQGARNMLIIAGSDYRGTAYGVFELSARLGVGAWAWWADVAPLKKKNLSVNIDNYTSAEPSVKYRGIFINDEDWGLQPWAAKTFEPETGDIGPKTYRKVFELLLRLKANLIWPAMHPSTKAFYHYPGNVDAAADYQIVIGSSHAEPMLRNNVSEWDEKSMGHFNYLTNQPKVKDYWETRVKESARMNAIYTIGMRGVHDSGIEGVKTVKETVPLLERIFTDQRDMLKQHIDTDVTKVPQAFTAYKEVLEVYNAGLKVPDDVTLVWPDDNYGYIQRLSDEQESKRSGGAGVYYHISYWGRPHDYLWLSTTSPGLIAEEMTKAYRMNAKKIWVVNVGDIKPGEYNTQLFLDMAYNIKPFLKGNYLKRHLHNWVSKNIDAAGASALTQVMERYYALAFERKPEYMGWSQTEPTTQVKPTQYNHFYYGDQAAKRIAAYNALEQQVKALKVKISPARKNAFYQLIYYPAVGASLMNKKWLYYDKAQLYAAQGRISSRYYHDLSVNAYNGIIEETKYYNTQLSGGKWANLMSMEPRKLPVFSQPNDVAIAVKAENTFSVQTEGNTIDTTSLTLPDFNNHANVAHFIDVFLTKEKPVTFNVTTSAPWIKVSEKQGRLVPTGNNSQIRLWVSVDWSKAPKAATSKGIISIKAPGREIPIAVNLIRNAVPTGFQGFVETCGYLSIYARNFQQSTSTTQGAWQIIDGSGKTGQFVQAGPIDVENTFAGELSATAMKLRPKLIYNFYTYTNAAADISLYTLPTFALNNNFNVRYAVSVDDGPIELLTFKTFGRSEEWKQAVLSNSIMRSVKTRVLKPGTHKLQVHMVDPGVVIDRMVIDLGGLKPFYGVLPESKLIK